jgi:hypothetical protein
MHLLPGHSPVLGVADMSKVSTFARLCRELLIAMLLVSIVVLSTGCGGSSSSASVPPPTGNTPPVVTPPAPIEGVATPTSVAVVTATNAQ